MSDAPLQLYFRVPFCRTHCTFCHERTFVADEATLQTYGDALLKEAEAAAPDFTGSVVQSVCFGGGCPTLLPQEQFVRLCRRLRRLYRFAEDAEVTVEAAPNRVNAGWMVAFQHAGVNRLSLELVTGHSGLAEQLGLNWSLGSSETSLMLPQMYGLRSYEGRLLYGLPSQTGSAFRLGVQMAVRFHTPEISLIPWQPAGPLAAQPRPDDLQTAQMLAYAAQHLTEKGYREYTPGVWCLPGHECRRTLALEAGSDFLSFGTGTRSRTDGVLYQTTPDLGTYLYHSDEPERLYTVLARE